MTAAALVLAWALPLALALLCLAPGTRRPAYAALPAAAVPALLLVLFAEPGAQLHWPAALLGMRLALDAIAWTFVLLTGAVGLLGGAALALMMRDDPRRYRFAGFYLAGLAGNLGAALAYDIVTFYGFFALMTFAAYGLVIHAGGAEARRAGGIYIVLVVLGEGMLLGGLLLVAAGGIDTLAEVPAAVAGSPHRGWIMALLLGGFGVKAGLLPWHVSLPPAYAATPVAGGVLLGGAMIHAGLLGWLRLLPFGAGAFPGWGMLLVLAGSAGMFYGVAVGLLQTQPRAMLGYSSISQTGFMLVALGLALVEPPLWPLTLAAVMVYAVHHALVKATLFLGVGIAASTPARHLAIAALILPALMLAGFPFTTGAAAKLALKDAAHAAVAPWAGALPALFACGSLGTALLLLRFLAALRREPSAPVAYPRLLAAAGAAAFVATLIIVAALPQVEWEALRRHWLDPATLWSEAWPVLGAAAVAFLWWRQPASRRARMPRVPPGDVIVPLEWLWRRYARQRRHVRAPRLPRPAFPALPASWQGALQRWSVGSLLFLLSAALLLLLLMR